MNTSELHNRIIGNAGPPAGKSCVLRWEITHKCSMKCKHCIIADKKPSDDLSYEDCGRVLHSYQNFLSRNNLAGRMVLTGGDPFLRKDFLDILENIREYRLSGFIYWVAIQGNPVFINEEMAGKLKYLGIDSYGLSTEGGDERVHDFFRKPGSFRQTLSALNHLRQAGIKTSMSLTVSKLNAPNIIEVIKTMLQAGLYSLHIAPLIASGRGEELKEHILSPPEYRQVLLDVLNFLDTLDEHYRVFKASTIADAGLYARLFYELGRWQEYLDCFYPYTIIPTQLSPGLTFAVLSDGTVWPGRFIPVKIGQVPRDSFQEIYESSGLLKSFEDNAYLEIRNDKFEQCRTCPVALYCKNIGMTYFVSGSPYGPAVGCWVEPV
ncbi:MAG: radical SAM protein [Planctomycetes bacterium]|nr:radical SAM protein [Planctomycetota bacterium]